MTKNPEIGVAQCFSPVVVRNKFYSIAISPVEIVEERVVTYQGPIQEKNQPKGDLKQLFEKIDKELKRFCDDDEVMNRIKKLIHEIKIQVFLEE